MTSKNKLNMIKKVEENQLTTDEYWKELDEENDLVNHQLTTDEDWKEIDDENAATNLSLPKNRITTEYIWTVQDSVEPGFCCARMWSGGGDGQSGDWPGDPLWNSNRYNKRFNCNKKCATGSYYCNMHTKVTSSRKNDTAVPGKMRPYRWEHHGIYNDQCPTHLITQIKKKAPLLKGFIDYEEHIHTTRISTGEEHTKHYFKIYQVTETTS